MKFSDFDTEAKKRNIGSEIFKLETGENRLRIVSEPEAFGNHYMGKGQASSICTGTLCKQCEIKEPTYKIMLYIVDRTDEQVKLAIMPWSVYKGLGTLAKSSDWGFDGLPPYDVVISRQGEELATKYSVTPTKNEKPLTNAQIDDLQKRKPTAEIIKTMAQKSFEKAKKDPHSDPNYPEFLDEPA